MFDLAYRLLACNTKTGADIELAHGAGDDIAVAPDLPDDMAGAGAAAAEYFAMGLRMAWNGLGGYPVPDVVFDEHMRPKASARQEETLAALVRYALDGGNWYARPDAADLVEEFRKLPPAEKAWPLAVADMLLDAVREASL